MATSSSPPSSSPTSRSPPEFDLAIPRGADPPTIGPVTRDDQTIPPQWSIADVATHIGVRPVTVRAYVARGQMPEPDGTVGGSPWWHPETITTWHAARRGQGWRARPRT